MSLPELSIGFAPDVEELLAAVGLPVVDLRADDRVRWYSLRDPSGHLLGVAGLELYGQHGLLRSMAVRADVRGTGLGRRLLMHAQAEAARLGVVELFLLTETAQGWFESQGYRVRRRPDAPAAIASSSQFAGVCPATAALLSRRLESTVRGGSSTS